MTLDILSIQAFTVSCKCVFSSSKEIYTICKSQINLTFMKALQVLKYHIQQEVSLNFTQETSQAEKKKNLEDEIERSEKKSSNM